MATVVRSFAIQGIDGYPVDIEVKMLEGQPVISIIGLGDQAVKEAAERIQAAIDESGYVFPKKRVIISLAPSDKKKSGSHFDLAMAIGVLCQNGDIVVKNLKEYGFIGELSLDGRLRFCRGILPMIIAGQKKGIKKIIVPEANLKEAGLVHGVEILGFHDLTGVIRCLEGKTSGGEIQVDEKEKGSEESGTVLDFKDVKGQDELAEFSRRTLDALRQPIEDKKVSISRVNGTHTFPSSFMFITAMNPCPCGYYPGAKCKCTDYEIIKYRGKISGPIMDRIDIQKEVHPVDFFAIADQKSGTSSEKLRTKVEKARKIQQERYAQEKGINCNAQMTTELIQRYCVLDKDSLKLLRETSEKYGYSARVIHKLLRLARTSADLDGEEKIRQKDIEKVLTCRELDKSNSKMVVVK